MFSLSGDVERPGVYEVPFETTLGALIEQAGGIRGNLRFKAIAPSGPSGGFVPRYLRVEEVTLHGAGQPSRAPEASEIRCRATRAIHRAIFRWRPPRHPRDPLGRLDLARAIGLMLGAGIVVYSDEASIMDQAANCLEFFHKESCGKCTPCRLGCQKLVRIAGVLRGSSPEPADLAFFERGVDPAQVRQAVVDLAGAMSVTSICGLGRVAANPLVSVLEHFGAECASPGPAPGRRRIRPEGGIDSWPSSQLSG